MGEYERVCAGGSIGGRPPHRNEFGSEHRNESYIAVIWFSEVGAPASARGSAGESTEWNLTGSAGGSRSERKCKREHRRRRGMESMQY